MKVLFVSPWTKTLFGDERAVPGHPHIGLAYLTAVSKRAGHQVRIFDQPIENRDEGLFELIDEFHPDIVSITAFSYCYRYVCDLLQLLKTRTEVPLIIGGPHVAAVGSQVLVRTAADFAMRGEAEVAFLIFLEELGKKYPDFSRVPNLLWRTEDGEIKENENAPFITDLDSLPFPDFSEFKLHKYSYYDSHTMPLITSRGCPYNCNYCSVHLSMGHRFRVRSPENVVAELEHWYRQGFVNFEINDDCFTLDLKRAERICNLIAERGLEINYQLYNGIRADRISEALLKKMKNSGCVFISYGAESGDQGVIDMMGKGIRLEAVEKAVALTNKVGIRNSVNFMIGHIGETYEKAMKTLALARRLPTDFVNVYNTIPYPGTVLYEWIEKNGRWIYHPDYVLENIGSRDLKPVFETPEFTEEERIKALKQGFALYEKTVLRFRLGRVLGEVAFWLMRIGPLAKLGRHFALHHRWGFFIYRILSFRSRK